MLTKADVQKQIDSCNKCGSCQFHCPTYRVSRDENLVARGRNYLVRRYLQEGSGDLLQDREVVKSLDGCLLCEACTAGCPSGVKTSDIVLYHRQELLRTGTFERALKERLYKAVFANRTVFPFLGWGANLYRHLPGEPNLAGTRDYLTGYLDGKTLKGTWPPGKPLPVKATGKRASRRFAFFGGCASNTFFHKAAADAVEILSHLGEVTLVDNYCCGAPLLSLGDWRGFGEVARKNAEILSGGKWDFIVSDCATCASTLKKYARLGIGCEPAGPVVDFVEVLHREKEFLAEAVRGVEEPFTFHYPCHLARGQNLRKETSELLFTLFGDSYVTHGEDDSCCGGAGTYGVFNRAMSEKIVAGKLQKIARTPAKTIVSSCPGCLMQLNFGVNRFSAPEGSELGGFTGGNAGYRVVALASLLARRMGR